MSAIANGIYRISICKSSYDRINYTGERDVHVKLGKSVDNHFFAVYFVKKKHVFTLRDDEYHKVLSIAKKRYLGKFSLNQYFLKIFREVCYFCCFTCKPFSSCSSMIFIDSDDFKMKLLDFENQQKLYDEKQMKIWQDEVDFANAVNNFFKG